MSINSSVDPVIGHILLEMAAPLAGGASDFAIWLGDMIKSVSTTFTAEVVDILDYAILIKIKLSEALAGYDLNGSGELLYFLVSLIQLRQ
jgi:hypothetical protein